MDRDRDRRTDDTFSYRPARSPPPRRRSPLRGGDSYRSTRSPPRRPIPDSYVPGAVRGARPRSRSPPPYRRRSRSPIRSSFITGASESWRRRSPPRRGYSPRRESSYRGDVRGRSPRREGYNPPYGARSPVRSVRGRSPLPRREPSPARSRGYRSPPPVKRERYGSPAGLRKASRYAEPLEPGSRRHRYGFFDNVFTGANAVALGEFTPADSLSPRRAYSPRTAYRHRTPSSERVNPLAVHDWRRRSPVPVSGEASGRESVATSRRSSPPPVHPSRAAQIVEERPPRPAAAEPFSPRPRSPYRARSPERRDRERQRDRELDRGRDRERERDLEREEPRDYDRDRDFDREKQQEDYPRERSPVRRPDTPPRQQEPREREYSNGAPPTGPAATRNGEFARAPPTGPSSSRNFPPPGPAVSAHNRPPPIPSGPSRGGRGSRGYMGDYSRDYSHSPYQRRGSSSGWHSPAVGRGGPYGGPPTGPRGGGPPPHGPSSHYNGGAFAPANVPFRGSNNSTSTTYPRTQRFRDHLADVPAVVPGGQRAAAADVVDMAKLHRLEEEAGKLRELIAEKEARKRRDLRAWEAYRRESENATLRADLAEETLRGFSGEGDVGGAAF